MTRGAAFRGQPLLLLTCLLGGWLALRVAFWEAPFAQIEPLRRLAAVAAALPAAAAVAVPVSAAALQPRARTASAQAASGRACIAETEARALPPPPVESRQTPAPQLLAYRQPAPRPAAAPSPAGVVRTPVAPVSRWSADGWLLLRRDAAGPVAAGRPSYGRSQAGAVLRYRLSPGSRRDPQAFLRVSSALGGSREREVAAGVSLRPLARVPVRLHAEARFGQSVDRPRFRPAIYAVSEFPPLALPLGLRGEAYVQGGYVGGEFATAFADGQARADRPLVRTGKMEASAGLGAWGGAQKGSSRLDAGPTVALTFPLGQGFGRIAADYRFRVAGEAEPSSGPALTVSAGF